MSNFKRNEKGLVEGVEYLKRSDGTIDWLRMVKPEYFVLNKQYQFAIEKKYKDTLASVEKKMQTGEIEVDDNFKLILLQGIKELCFLRGYKSVTYPFTHVDDAGVYARCQITWVENPESNGEEVFEDGADATINNTTGFGQQYLTAIALNRSFVRCVRNYLRIPVLGFDEIGPNNTGAPIKNPKIQETQTEQEEKPDNYGLLPQNRVEKIADEMGYSFERIKSRAVAGKFDGAGDWQSYSDIPDKFCMKIIGSLKREQKKASK